jgi:glutathione S-transferase
MITLYQFDTAWGLPNPSPFCFKVENYLRMTETPFTIKSGDPRKTPKQKLPTIDDEGTLVCDSAHIVEHLKKTKGDKLDAGLSAEDRALSHVLRRMLEEGLYWCVVFTRWSDDAGFALAEEVLLRPKLPPVIRSFLPGIIRGQIRKQLFAQGTGRHSAEEIYALGRADLDALSGLLGDKPFFLGDDPRSIDASAYAFLGVILWAPPENPLQTHMKSRANLVAYCERMKARFYPAKS